MSDHNFNKHASGHDVTLEGIELFRILRIQTNYYQHRPEHHELLKGINSFTDETMILGAGVRYAGEEKAIAFNASPKHPSPVNITESASFSLFFADKAKNSPRLAFQITGPRPIHQASGGKIASGRAHCIVHLTFELDKTMHIATLHTAMVHGQPARLTQKSLHKLLAAISLSLDNLAANKRTDFTCNLGDSLPARAIRARRKLGKATP